MLACGFAMQLQLATCIADPECLENLACLQLCNGRKDEAGCQVPSLDLFIIDAISFQVPHVLRMTCQYVLVGN